MFAGLSPSPAKNILTPCISSLVHNSTWTAILKVRIFTFVYSHFASQRICTWVAKRQHKRKTCGLRVCDSKQTVLIWVTLTYVSVSPHWSF
jgi:hypothetical protein